MVPVMRTRTGALLLAITLSIGAIILRQASIPAPEAAAPPARHGFAVFVQGELLGYTADRELPVVLWEQILDELGSRAPGELVILSELSVEPVELASEQDLLEQEQLAEVLAGAVYVEVRAFGIYVEDLEVVVVATESAAQAVLSRVRQVVLETLAPGGNTELRDVWVREVVSIRPTQAPLEAVRDVEMASRILLRGTDRTLVHTVQRGQSLWSVAQAHDLTVDQLRRANPGLTSDLLQIGQKLNLVVPDPYVTVETIEHRTYTEAIPFSTEVIMSAELWPWEEKVQRWGENGQREITLEIKRENGREVSRVIVSTVVMKDPVKQVVIRGNRAIPAHGTGQYTWPLNGPITSRFGWRRLGWHNGVDIGAPMGTPIKAADGGMVTFAAAHGGYGNMIIIDHGERDGKQITTAYAHLSKFAVRVGQQVKAGDVIGNVGNTGRSTGPHLHFEVRIDGQPVDPTTFYERAGRL
ncbi:MAG: M23 family metallopeptidase [Bacillota bacterium]